MTVPPEERATEQAWLAPLPPGRRVRDDDEIVSPGLTMWESAKNSSMSDEPGSGRGAGIGSGGAARSADRRSEMQPTRTLRSRTH